MVGSRGARWKDGRVAGDQVKIRGDSLVKLFHRDALRWVFKVHPY